MYLYAKSKNKQIFVCFITEIADLNQIFMSPLLLFAICVVVSLTSHSAVLLPPFGKFSILLLRLTMDIIVQMK